MKRIIILSTLLFLTACQQMGPTQVGLKYRNLPPKIGPVQVGGIASQIIEPGQLAVLMPWDTLYVFDTSVKDISWPSSSKPEDTGRNESFLNTRALDGNEVALAVTVRYRINPESKTLITLVNEVARSDGDVRQLVAAVARADIRAYMNQLRTAEFLDEQSRYRAIDAVRESISRRLLVLGISLERVILDDFRFDRALEDNSVDSSYQEKISEIQKLQQDTERERSRIETVRAKKKQEFNQVQASINRAIAEADGYKKQAAFQGDAYFEGRSNEAKGILALGKAEVEGLVQQIKALEGPGGRAILRLEIAKQLLAAKPNFVVLNGSSSMQVQKLDTNELLRQLGLTEALIPENKNKETKKMESNVVRSPSATK